MSKFEVQTIDRDGYVDDTSLEDSLEDAVATAAGWAGADEHAIIKIIEQVEIPFTISRGEAKPSGRPPVSRTVNGVTVTTL